MEKNSKLFNENEQKTMKGNEQQTINGNEQQTMNSEALYLQSITIQIIKEKILLLCGKEQQHDSLMQHTNFINH